MSLPLKIAAGLLAMVAILFVAVAITVTLLVDPENYRPLIVDSVERTTGRRFELRGDIGLEVFPCCAVTLGPARLGNPAEFPDGDFVAIDRAALSLKLWPLLTRREVRFGHVTLDGVVLDLVALPDGRVNWEFAEDVDSADQQPALTGLHVDGLAVRDGQLRFRDLQEGLDYLATGVQFGTGAISRGDVLVIESPELALAVTGADLPGGRAELAAEMRRLELALDGSTALTLDALQAELRLLETRLRIDASGRASSAELWLEGTLTLDRTSPQALLAALSDDPWTPSDPQALTALEGTADWTLGATSLQIDAVDFRLDDSGITGSVALTDFDTGALTVELALDQLNLDRYLPATEPGGTASPADPVTLPLDALTDLNLQGALRIGALHSGALVLANVAIDVDSATRPASIRATANLPAGRIEIEGQQVGSDADRLAGMLTLQGLKPRSLLETLNIAVDTADPDVLTAFAGTSRWQLTPRTLAFEDMRWTLDRTELTGTLQIDDFDSLSTRFNLALDELDLDAYLPPASADDEDAPTEIPLALLRTLTLDGRIAVRELSAFDILFRDVAARIRAADGVLRLDPASAGLYGGEYRGTMTLDARNERAQLILDQSLRSVQVEELLRPFARGDLLGGALSVSLAGTGAGNTAADLLRGITADIGLDLQDGVYRGVDVIHELRSARALLRNEAAPAAPASRETPIRALALQGRMTNGILQSDRLTLETPFLRMGGRGGLNLLDLELDYALNAELLRTPENAQGRQLAELLGKSVPLTIRGPVRSPRVRVDLKNLATTQLRTTVEQRAREALLERLTPRKRDAPPTRETPPAP